MFFYLIKFEGWASDAKKNETNVKFFTWKLKNLVGSKKEKLVNLWNEKKMKPQICDIQFCIENCNFFNEEIFILC